MNILTTGAKLHCPFIIFTLIFITFNYSYAQLQECPPPENNIEVCYKVNDFFLDFQCSKTNNFKTIALTIESVSGGMPPYTITTVDGSDGSLSKRTVEEGGSFIYSFSVTDLSDITRQKINFEIKDQVNQSTNLMNSGIANTIFNNVFSVDCIVPYFLVSDNKVIRAGENEVFKASECILLAPTFEVHANANFEANIEMVN